MELKEQNILFFPRTMAMGGTEKVVLELCEVLQPLVRSITVCSCGGVNEHVLQRMGIRHVTVPDIENKSPKTLLTTARILRRLIKEQHINVIHTHHRMAAFYVAMLGLYRRCVFINTSHNTFYDKKLLTRFAYKHARMIACGEMVKRNLTDTYRLPERQITVIRNAVKPFAGALQPDKTLAAMHGQGCFVVANIGRLTEQKGMCYFLDAVPAITAKHPQARFVVIGSGEDEAALKKQAQELGIERYVTFMGYRSDVQNLMAQVDLVVLSSLWEGLPLTPIEAFSVGRTVVATAVDGTVEIVQDGVNGFLIPPKDPAAIAGKVCAVIEHPELRQTMEQAAQQTYQAAFSFARFAEAAQRFYKELP